MKHFTGYIVFCIHLHTFNLQCMLFLSMVIILVLNEIELLNFIFMSLSCAVYNYELVNTSKILSPLMGFFHISLLQIEFNILFPSFLFKL